MMTAKPESHGFDALRRYGHCCEVKAKLWLLLRYDNGFPLISVDNVVMFAANV